MRAVDETVPAALSGWRPTLEISSNAGKRALRQSGIFGDGSTQNMSPASVGVRLSQPLFRGGATMAQTQASEARVLAGRASLTDVEQQVLAAAASAYVTVIRDQSVIDLNVNNEQVLARQLQATRDRFHVGEVTRTDVSQAEARSADARASRIAAEGNLEASRATYENLIGTAPGTLEFPTMSVFSVPETVEAALDLGLRRNPAVLRADALAAAARHDIDAAAARVLPHITLSASAQRSWDPNSFSSKTDVAEIVTSLVVPLYQSGAELRAHPRAARGRRAAATGSRRGAPVDTRVRGAGLGEAPDGAGAGQRVSGLGRGERNRTRRRRAGSGGRRADGARRSRRRAGTVRSAGQSRARGGRGGTPPRSSFSVSPEA